MKVYVLSDLHLEFGAFEPPDVSADVVVLAGDIGLGLRGLQWAAQAFGSTPVVYVPGNHEYYGHALPRLDEKLAEAAEHLGGRVRFLNPGGVTLDGVRFVGASLWSDFELSGSAEFAMATAESGMNDYRQIRVSPAYRKLQARDTRGLHMAHVARIREELRDAGDGPVVVVTHAAPSARSLPARFADHPLAPAFASRLDGLVEESGAALWIHGHTHWPVDYRIGHTRVLSNPRGYVGSQEVSGFRPDLVVELAPGGP